MLGKLRKRKADNDPGMELVLKVQRFSNEAYQAGQSFVTKAASVDESKVKARELAAVLPELAELAKTLPAPMKPDIDRALSEANLDISYVLADGKLPASIRLGRFVQEQKSQQ